MKNSRNSRKPILRQEKINQRPDSDKTQVLGLLSLKNYDSYGKDSNRDGEHRAISDG